MPLVLYGNVMSPPCRSVFMVKEYLNLTMELKQIMPMKGEHLSPEYIKRNHIHSIPYLEDDGFRVVDSHAIITYLVSKYGGKFKDQLYPSDLETRSTIDQRLFLDASNIYPRFVTALIKVVKEKVAALPEENVKSIEEAYEFLEKYLERSKFLAADHITLADISLIATISTANVLVPIGNQFPKVLTWWNKIKEQDWYQRGNGEGYAVAETFLKNTLAEGSKLQDESKLRLPE